MTPAPRLALLEIGGTSVKIALADSEGVVLARRHPTGAVRGPDPVQALAALLRAACAEAGFAPEVLLATVPGFIDLDFNRVLRAANVPELDGLPLASALRAALKLPVRLERDVVLQLLGERAAGAVREARHVLAVYLGTGIGAAYFGEAEVFRGGGWALEIGHVPRGDPNAPWGDRVETVASGAALAALAAAHNVPVETLFLHDGAGAPAAALRAAVEAQARLIATAVVLFSPRVLLIGGGVVDMAGYPRDTLASLIGRALPPTGADSAPEIRWARLGWQAAVEGARQLARAPDRLWH